MADYVKDTITPLDSISDHGFGALAIGVQTLHVVPDTNKLQKLHLSVTNTSAVVVAVSLTLQRTTGDDQFGPLTASIDLGVKGGADDFRFDLDILVGRGVTVSASADVLGAVYSGWIEAL